MAISFSKSISVLKLLNTYNNNVVEFTSDDTLDATKCNINLGGLDFEITPINNVFRFNYKEVVSALINSNNFKDSIIPTSNFEGDTSLSGSYLVTYTITFADTSTEQTTQTYVFLKSVEQIANVSNRLLTEQQILCNTKLTAFKGYPFDVGYYLEGDVIITNTATGYSFTLKETSVGTNRIFFMLGNNLPFGETLYNGRVLNLGGVVENNACITWLDLLSVGYNNITVSNGTTKTLEIKLNDISCGGTYLKWFNLEKGAWNYWLFNPIHRDTLKTKTLDDFNVDFNSIDETYTTSLITGKTAIKERNLTALTLEEYEMEQIKSLFTSPRVELYNGTYGDTVTAASWQTVKVRDKSITTSNTKRDLIDVKLTIEINQYTNA